MDAETEQYATSANLDARIALHTRYATTTIGWYSWVFALLDLHPGETVLEVGLRHGPAVARETPAGFRLASR